MTCNDNDLFRTPVCSCQFLTHARPFWYGLPRINILKVRFWEGGHKKEYAVYARENDNNSGRPLRLKKRTSIISIVTAGRLAHFSNVYSLRTIIIITRLPGHYPASSKSPNTSGSRLTNDGRSRITHKKQALPCSHESAESLSQSGDPACVCLLFSKCFVWFIWSTSCTCTNGLRFPRYIYIQDTLHSSKSKLESFNNLPQTKSTCDRKAKAPSWHALFSYSVLKSADKCSVATEGLLQAGKIRPKCIFCYLWVYTAKIWYTYCLRYHDNITEISSWIYIFKKKLLTV